MQGLFVYAIIRGGLRSRVLCDESIGAIVGFNDIPVRTHTYLNEGGKIFYLLPRGTPIGLAIPYGTKD